MLLKILEIKPVKLFEDFFIFSIDHYGNKCEKKKFRKG
jgi:hypothetical protein